MTRLLPLLFLTLFLFSCEKSDREPEQAVSEISLEAASFADLSGWKSDDLTAARRAFLRSCDKIANLKTPFISEASIKIPTTEYQKLCRQGAALPAAKFKNFLERNFRPYLVKYQGSPSGKFTSYYEAAIHASRRRTAEYQYPIYGLPHDLVELNLRDFDPALPARKLIGRVDGNRLVPYHTREYIEQNTINAPVILWGNNAVDILIMQIQGSAVAELDDGSKVRIAFAGSNGHPFKGIGSILLEKGLIKPGKASMGEIRKWLNSNYAEAYPHLLENKRFIFHRLTEASGPIGAQGVPLEAGRSLAVDRSFIPLGSLLWLETTGPDKQEIRKLVVAQDIGSAIKGAVRGDYFWGSGAEGLEFAGRMNAQGQYYILLPRSQENQP